MITLPNLAISDASLAGPIPQPKPQAAPRIFWPCWRVH